MTASEARAALPRVLDLVEAGEEVTITRHGREVAVVRSPRHERAGRTARMWDEVATLGQGLEEARRQPLDLGEGLPPGRADQLVADLRADRDVDLRDRS